MLGIQPYNRDSRRGFSAPPRPSPLVIVGGDHQMAKPKSIRPSSVDVMDDQQRARFWASAQVGTPTECWPWLRCTKPRGYGVFNVYVPNRGRTYFLPHRVAWELTHGAIPAGLQIDHLCRQRSCVNPAHLDLVTSKENTLRGVGITAQAARRKHCKRGHAWTPENTRHDGAGRRCLTCRMEYERQTAERKRERRRARADAAPRAAASRPSCIGHRGHLFSTWKGGVKQYVTACLRCGYVPVKEHYQGSLPNARRVLG